MVKRKRVEEMDEETDETTLKQMFETGFLLSNRRCKIEDVDILKIIDAMDTQEIENIRDLFATPKILKIEAKEASTILFKEINIIGKLIQELEKTSKCISDAIFNNLRKQFYDAKTFINFLDIIILRKIGMECQDKNK
jgi:hypothetical protein